MKKILIKLKTNILILFGFYCLGFLIGLNKTKTTPETSINNNDFSILNIMLNNFFITFSALFITIITFGIFAVFMSIKEGYLLGKLFAYYKISLWKSIFFGILPHGILEITGLLISLALGINVVIELSKNGLNIKIKNELIKVLNSYHEAVAPLILIGAFVEYFITPILIKLFLY